MWGLKREICLQSEEIWHQVHVAVSIATIPFALISGVLVFISSIGVKVIVALILCLFLPLIWNAIVKIMTEKDVLMFEDKQKADLDESIKKNLVGNDRISLK